MLYSDQVKEAIGIIDGMLDLLLRSVKSAVGREAYELRRSVGYLRVNAERSIKEAALGTDMRACFDAAVAAGAIPERLESVRRYLAGTICYSGIAFSVACYGILMCVSAISTRGINSTYKSQEEVTAVIARMQVIFQQVKEMVADHAAVSIYNTANKLASSVTRYLSRTKLQLPRIVMYKTMTSLPTLTLSNMIFRVGDRAEEIAAENHVIHPLFCPRELRVLSR